MSPPLSATERLRIVCRDGVQLGGHFWPSATPPKGFVVINPATGVLARYYHFYASFLAGQGYDVLTYDYRGIGQSRPGRLRGCGYRWRDWGQLDFDAAIRFAAEKRRAGPLLVVGHSVGGFLPGLAEHGFLVDRMLTVGAQYAYWPDYAPKQRLRLFLKWHVAMPALTAVWGYFPGKRLGWLEDLPAGVANEWSFKGRRTEASYPAETRAEVLARFAAFRAPILAVAVTDDELGTLPAIRRTLAYYAGAERQEVLLAPADLDVETIGHFGLFHARFADGFWPATLRWLGDGINPWADPAGL
ncbi:alpha/beta fold hydrolase [Methylocella sp. CPCC 101449]|uniref:alpha/beta hydrolase family protein n=1 Tax=Methylocella sp. CPCC 101449 TaxID=2987531 RepID=UPI00288E6B1D|nr:alpha/beta fold hydrolase [Methylocella sp. CPCC 101449]MDT2022095.1 alpha/beta fold hydrolase [Methylocella sp. CPCC 101449]